MTGSNPLPRACSTVGLLEAGSGTWTAELLGLAAARVRNQQGAIVLQQDLLDLVLGRLIDVCHSTLHDHTYWG